MDKRNRPYLHFSDRPIVKIVGLLLTSAYFFAGYFLVFVGLELGAGSLLGLLYPCVMIVHWESLKKRNFWPFWLVVASVCLLILSHFDETTLIGFLAVSAYWLCAFVCCVFLIFCCSRLERRARRRDEEGVVAEVTVPDPVKDAFLEALFDDE